MSGPRLQFEPRRAEHADAIRAFNDRLDAAANPHVFRLGLPGAADGRPPEGRPVWQEVFVAVEGAEVRGGVTLQHQQFVVGNAVAEVVNVQLPVSEGTADPKYAHVGMFLIRSVLQRYPFAFAVGMGGVDRPLAKLLAAMRWDVQAAPFFFRVHRAARFLRLVPRLRNAGLRTRAADVAAVTGAGWLGLRLLEARRALGAARASRLRAERVEAWGAWAEEVWEAARGSASLLGVRDRANLDALYPPGGRLLLYRLTHRGRTVGWTVLLRTQMRGSAYFGDLVVGTVLDALAAPGYEGAAVRAASRALHGLGVDVSLSNHPHVTWQRAFRDAAYLRAPSNYVVALSRPLVSALAEAGADAMERVHITRGDGDGRIHL